MLLGSDILRLFFTGPYLASSPLCSVSGVDCPSVDPRQLLLPASLLSCDQLPSALLSSHQLQLLVLASLWVASSTLVRVPFPLPDTARFQVQESFVWFRAKTDSSALAACPHSATKTRRCAGKFRSGWNIKTNLQLRKAIFQPIMNFTLHSFRADSIPYMSTKGSTKVLKSQSTLRTLTRHISDKIENRWRPINPHHK